MSKNEESKDVKGNVVLPSNKDKEWDMMNGHFSDIDEEVGPDEHPDKDADRDESSSGAVSICARICPQRIACIPKRHQKVFRIWICPLICIAITIVIIVVVLMAKKKKGTKNHGPPPTDICTLSNVPYPDVAKMTLEQKVGQMSLVADYALSSDGWDASGWNIGAVLAGPALEADIEQQSPVAKLKHVRKFQQAVSAASLPIPLLYGIDAVHGHNGVYGATIFPHNIGLGSARDAALVQDIAVATAQEMVATGIRWNFAPCIAVCRDPRWGRCYESFGEDPALVNMMNSAIDGYQKDVLRPGINVAATAKHFVADGGTKKGENAGLTEMSFEELDRIHLFPYREAIARDVQFVMASYSAVNGTRMSVHKYLLTDILKDKLGFKGVIVSDWGALYPKWGMGGDFSESVKAAINAGMDLVMVPENYVEFITILKKLVKKGDVPMSRIDDAVTRILQAKLNLGLFNQTCSPAEKDEVVMSNVGTAENKALARNAVRKSLVLLKTNATLFPLPVAGAKILVAGRHADDIGLQSGGWTLTWQGGSGDTIPGTTILEGIMNATKVLGDAQTKVSYVPEPVGTEVADYAIVVVGEMPYAEGKGDDPTLELNPASASAIKNVCPRMRCIVVLVSGRPLMVQTLLPSMSALVAAWLPGSEGGGVADVLFGAYDFSGRSPISWPRTVTQLPMDYNSTTYDPLFKYGYGLNKMGKVL